MKRYFWILCMVVFAAGCTSLEKGGLLTPQPAESEYFKTDMAGFMMNVGQAAFAPTYFLDLKVIKKLENGAYLETYFENPADPDSPIIVSQPLTPDASEVRIESPAVQGLKSYEGYVVDVFIYDGPKKEHLIGKHRQIIQSLIDEALIKRMQAEGRTK